MTWVRWGQSSGCSEGTGSCSDVGWGCPSHQSIQERGQGCSPERIFPLFPVLSSSFVLGITSRAQLHVRLLCRKATEGRAGTRAKRMFVEMSLDVLADEL